MSGLKTAILVVGCLVSTNAISAQSNGENPMTKREAAAAWTEDGLEKIAVKGLDVVYSRPGATLTGYKKVRLAPISVAFRRGWEKRGAPGERRVGTEDAQRIRDRLAALVHEQMSKQLSEGGYSLVDTAGDDVLDVDLSIINLYITAPDVRTAANVEIYAMSAGEMTLIAELSDSTTGDIITRVFDRATASESWAKRLTRIENAAEARAIAFAWAKALLKALDTAGMPELASQPAQK